MEDKATHANVEVLADHRQMGLQDASTWTPRELLLSVLNEIDNGKLNPQAIVLCISDQPINPEAVATIFRCSSPNLYVSLGLMEHAKAMMQARDD